jgi:Lon protease-like protein
MDQIIPLFPLKLVVFPQSRYPLHIFESRYKHMVKFCLQNDKGFGIVSQIGNDISNIGSFVKISTVLKEYDTGEYDIIVEGLNRFSIGEIDIHQDGYYTASVHEYNDINSKADIHLIEEIRNKFEKVLKKINLELDEAFWRNFINAGTKSFKIAEKSGLTIPEQQELLLLQDENTRLVYLKKHFEKLEEQISKSITNKIFTLNDGFIN